jgi:hypothetical protein
MTSQRNIRNFKIWLRHSYWQIAFAVLYFAGMVLFFPFRNVFWMNLDEGINLVKAQMVLRGFALYADIWNDQPPLLTYLLAAVIRLFGPRANAGRLLVLLLACTLMWAYLQFLSSVWGNWQAAAGAILLLVLPLYMDLSVSVLVGLPAIALGMVSLWALVLWHKTRTSVWLAVSALALALSILTKIFTGLLAPIFLAGILVGEFSRYRETGNWRRALVPALLWGTAFTLFLVIPAVILIHPDNFGQLLGEHIAARQLAVYRNDPSYSLAWQLQEAGSILLLAILGAVNVILSRRWLGLYALAWMGTAYLLLFRHVPVWSHQQLLITIPAAILAAGAAGEALSSLWSLPSYWIKARSLPLKSLNRTTWLNLASMGLFLLVLANRGPATLSAFNSSPAFKVPEFRATSSEVKFLRYLRQYAPQTRWLVTDLPMFAFYADLPVPPNLVVFSSKRVETGELTEEEVLKTIQEYRPEQILLGRFEFPSLRRHLKEQYRLVQARELYELYVSKDIIPVEPSN